MNQYPKISIIITNYNYREYIRFCIESCINQDYKGEIETIVVDDASTDHSDFVYHNYKNKGVKIIQLGINRGYSIAKNEGICQSSGELIATIDADDMLTEDSISTRVKCFVDNPLLSLVCAQAYQIRGDGDRDYWSKRLYKIGVSTREDKIHAQTVMVRRRVYIDYGLYDERLRSRADNEMWWRLRNVAKMENQFYHLKHPVAFYRKHEKSMIEYRKKHPEYNNEVTRILDEQKIVRYQEGINKSNTRFLKD